MQKFMKLYNGLFKDNSDSFIDIMKDSINKLDKVDERYRRNVKYTIEDYVIGIIEVLTNNISWRKYNGKIDGRILNNKHNHYCKIGIYDVEKKCI